MFSLLNILDKELCCPCWTNDAAPSSLMDSIMSPKVKIAEGEGIGVRSLIRSTLGIERHARAPKWD